MPSAYLILTILYQSQPIILYVHQTKQLNVVIFLWFKAQPTSPLLDIQLPTTKEEDKLQYDLQLIIV